MGWGCVGFDVVYGRRLRVQLPAKSCAAPRERPERMELSDGYAVFASYADGGEMRGRERAERYAGGQCVHVPRLGDRFVAAADARLYALWAVTLAIGLRRGEVLGLRWEDVDLGTGG